MCVMSTYMGFFKYSYLLDLYSSDFRLLIRIKFTLIFKWKEKYLWSSKLFKGLCYDSAKVHIQRGFSRTF